MKTLLVGRPAVAWVVALLAGLGIGDTGGAWSALLALAGCIALSGYARGGGRCVRAAALLVVAACGAARIEDANAAAAARIRGWLPPDGTAVGVEVRGRVLDVPEVCEDASIRLLLAGGPEGPGWRGEPRLALRVLPTADPRRSFILDLLPGDEIRLWCRVQIPRPTRDAEQDDARRGLLARGIDAFGTVKSPSLVEVVRRGGTTPERLLGALKTLARRRLDLALGTGTRARRVIGAMLLGDRAALDPGDARALRNTGLVHLLSISGLHVGILLVFLLALLGRARVGPWASFTLLALALTALSLLTGAQPPVLRSALAAGLLQLGRAVGRDGDSLNTLAVVAGTLALARPHVLWNPSFQLTVAATAGLLVFGRPMSAALPLHRLISLPLGISASAYVASTPIVLEHFGRAAPASLVANLGASVLCVATLVSGTTALIAAGIPAVGTPTACIAEGIVDAMFRFASAMEGIPGGSFRVGTPRAWLLVVYYALLGAAARPAGPLRKHQASDARTPSLRVVRLLVCLVLGFLHLGPVPPGRSTSARLSVLDVGQGQAVVLRGPTGGFLVVDAGGSGGGRFDAGERIVAPYLARRGCRRIEVILVTHGHDDHVGGVESLLRDFDVGELWIPAGSLSEPLVHRLAVRAVEQGSAVVLAERGLERERAGLDLRILHPGREDRGFSENDRSAVLRARLRGETLLIPGDLQLSGEERLLSTDECPRAEVLVVGHHGSSGSSGDAFLDAVAPWLGIVSVGAGNRFGHPGAATLDRLRKRRVAVYRTDLQGRIELRSGPGGWIVEATGRRSEQARE